MLSQYFKTLVDSAQKMATSQLNNSSLGPLQTVNHTNSFESQLQHGLYVPFSELTINHVGWSYRQSPVMVYGVQPNEHTLHLTACHSILKHTPNWVWITTHHAQQSLNHCEHCFTKISPQDFTYTSQNQDKERQPIDNKKAFSFLHHVQVHSHEYFNTQKIKLWQPGYPLENLPSVIDNKNGKSADIIDYEQCQNCTWKLPLDSNYSIPKEQRLSMGCDQMYCLLCMGERIHKALIIPAALRWKALQARFHYFNGVCTNWAHVQFHIDKSWHPLIKVVRQQGINLPCLYEPITCEGYVTLISPLVWKDQKRAILPDLYDDRIQLPKDWDFWHYKQVYASFRGQN